MISVCIFAGFLLISLLLMAAALALAAWAVGSPRGRFRVGLAAVFLLIPVNIAFSALTYAVPMKGEIPPWILLVLLAIVNWCVVFIVLRRLFRLSFGRTFSPFAAHVAIGIVIIGFAVMVMRPFLLEAFVFPTHSMMPTINPGDRFVVNKLMNPRRWDLVAYWTVEREPVIYCKRLVGLPGERLRFDQGGVFINDQPATVPPVLAGRCRASIPNMYNARYHDGDTIVLGNDEYFFVGDNIDISGDSRLSGPTKSSSLVGVVDLMYWPLSSCRIIR